MTLIELSLHLPNRPGQLAEIARLLAQKQINVASIHVDSKGARGDVRLVVSDPKGALVLLKKMGYAVQTHELVAIQLEDKAGSFLKVLDCLTDAGINIQHVVLLVQREGNRTLVGLGLDDLTRARRILRSQGFLAPGAERLVSNSDLIAAVPSIPSESVGLML
ncbi:MAG TPA: ACT domain-containing protein [Thermoplasmata archaeon]|nr:ACT domain-containing protein [Thermoplasmata archaeon]